MAPDQRGEVGEVIVADIHAVQPDLADGFLHARVAHRLVSKCFTLACRSLLSRAGGVAWSDLLDATVIA